ncbi:hypothetical protein SpCBS45565_g04958 [Spizellomyces sp. 'palustris']|nr:hypothetical protein SpCBS45565_g04958 [Spizellomyces sp. 'palustris']
MPMQVYEESVPASDSPLWGSVIAQGALLDQECGVPYQRVMEFISKIGQVVLRARVAVRDETKVSLQQRQLQEQQRRIELKLAATGMHRPPPVPSAIQPPVHQFDSASVTHNDLLALLRHTEFWRTSMPVNVDIYLGESRILLERWVVSYESSDQITSTEDSSSFVDKRREDLTDLILLVQSLYSYIRLMPLHAILAEGKVDKHDLRYCISTADGYPLSPVSDDEDNDDHLRVESRSKASERLDYFTPAGNTHGSSLPTVAFDAAAKLKVYKFRSASTGSRGKLHLSVVYDSSVAGMVAVGGRRAASPVKSPVKAGSRPESGPAIKSTSEGDLTDGKPKDDYSIGKPPRPSSEAPRGRRSSSSLGSPFPSPTMQRRVLGLAQWKLSSTERPRPVSGLGLSDSARQVTEGGLLFSGTNWATGVPGAKQGLPVEHSAQGPEKADHSDRARPVGIPFAEPIRDGQSPPKNRRPDLRLQIPTITTTSPIDHLDDNNISRTATTTTLRSINIPLSSSRPSHTYLFASQSSTTTPSELCGSFVGSYEESILSGRMSTLPSKPIRFQAEIGVVGFGKCASRSLRCPPHVSVEFDAFFYEVGEDEVLTPYVGFVEIGEAKGKREKADDGGAGDANGQDEDKKRESKTKIGGYRIPPKGQLQILIKNPARTAIKLFLLPYDFQDMPNNSKTFLRQKSYTVPSSTSASSKSPNAQSDHHPHPHLRYAIHVPVFRTEKGRVYVGPSLRVVFSHRALDGDEKVLVVSEDLGVGDGKYVKEATASKLDSCREKQTAEERDKVWQSGFR